MAEARDKSPQQSPANATAGESAPLPPVEGANPAPAAPPPWSAVWQLPVLVLGLILLGTGLYLGARSRAAPTLDQHLQQLSDYLKAGNLEVAGAQLESISAPAERAPGAARGRFLMLRADYLFLRQRERERQTREMDLAAAYAPIATLYAEARQLGQPLDGDHLARWARSSIYSGADAQALETVAQIQDGPVRRRYELIGELIRHRMAQPVPDAAKVETALEHLTRELAAAGVAAAREGNGQARADLEKDLRIQRVGMAETRTLLGPLGTGQADPDGLNRALLALRQEMVRLANDGGDRDLGVLDLLAAGGYQRLADLANAELSYSMALQKLTDMAKAGDHRPDLDEAAARAHIGLGQVWLLRAAAAEDRARLQTAREFFLTVLRNYPGSPALPQALTGLAEAEWRLALHADAVGRLHDAVGRLADKTGPGPQQERAGLERLVETAHAQLLRQGRHGEALGYLEALAPLYAQAIPTERLARLAQTHEAVAGDLWIAAGDRPGARTRPTQDRSGDERPAAEIKRLRQKAAEHEEQAGNHYLSHARAVLEKDPFTGGQSLRRAAASYERAHRWPKAIAVYIEFKRLLPADPARLEIMRRLGLAYQADGQYAAAAGEFRALFTHHPRSPDTYASLVPLAQCLVQLQDPDSAQRVLRHVLDNHEAIRPESAEYRDALIELGRLHYTRGEFEKAIAALTESVERYGDQALGPVLRFHLADALRQSAPQVRQGLEEAHSESRRQALTAEWTRRLDLGHQLYEQVIAALDSPPARSLSDVEQVCLRNAYFYAADCLYDLRRFEAARDLYDRAASRWQDHPASLIALVQLVNSNCELGRWPDAAAANERAKAHLKRISREAFDDPSMPMNRQHWEDWYRWTSQISMFSGAGGSAVTGVDATPRPTVP